MKFLIDECLSVELATLAIDRGHVESSHVIWLGKGGLPDWKLLPFILYGDWTFVTRNAYDFRGPAEAPGGRGLYARAEIHAGLVCLTAAAMTLDDQLDLFVAALDELQGDPDLINQVLEVEAVSRASIRLRRYRLPSE